MPSQIIFFDKNKADYSYSYVTATASEGTDYARNVLNRSNLNAWITTGSTDASNTTLVIDFTDERTFTDLILIKHNFKSFNIKWWDGAAYQDFTPAINETTFAEESSYYQVAAVDTTRVQVEVLGTQVADSEKFLYQFILTARLGQFESWPPIKSPLISRNRQRNTMLSGKSSVFENIGSFSCSLIFDATTSDADLTIVESIYDQVEGFLVWLCGGEPEQFATVRQGYRFEDIYLMKPSNEYSPEYRDGVYVNPIGLELKLEEVVE